MSKTSDWAGWVIRRTGNDGRPEYFHGRHGQWDEIWLPDLGSIEPLEFLEHAEQESTRVHAMRGLCVVFVDWCERRGFVEVPRIGLDSRLKDAIAAMVI